MLGNYSAELIVDERAPRELLEKILRFGVVRATVHTPVYTMHKFWARRPWKLFRKLILEFTKPGDIILDPFAGGGVTLVEGLIARRKVIAVDLNPLAVKIMKHEVEPLDVASFKEAIRRLSSAMEPLATKLYAVRCPKCGGDAVAIWTEYETQSRKPLRTYYACSSCGSKDVKTPESGDLPEVPSLPPYERVEIPPGDKTGDLIKRGIRFFDELFTKRNLYMVLKIKEEIEKLDLPPDSNLKSFLLFTLSSTLKWASIMSHLRGSVVEGWALHAYWVYPRFLEINVWRQFLNRAQAVIRGKEFTNKRVGGYAKEARTFDELKHDASYMILQADSRRLNLPSESVDAVITDPPYGDNVNYAELADYFLWLFGERAPKEEEIIINRTRGLTLYHYKKGLEEVFLECYRVLKPGGLLIATFNSKDSAVLGAFVYANVKAGFKLAGAIPQPYLEAYETTFHALQPSAMTFDYVFFFYKSAEIGDVEEPPNAYCIGLRELNEVLREKLEQCKKAKCTERDFRMAVYPTVIRLFTCSKTMTQIEQVSRILENFIEANKTILRRNNKR